LMEECPLDDWHLGCDPDRDLCHRVLALSLASFHPYHRIHLQPVKSNIKKYSSLKT
jgi:hypothetical protein